MSAPPTTRSATGQPSGGLARVLARAALPPVVVPSPHTEPSGPAELRAARPAVPAAPSDAVPDRPGGGRPSVRPAAPRAVPGRPGQPVVAEPVADDEDPSPRPISTVTSQRPLAAVPADDEHRVAQAEARPTPSAPPTAPPPLAPPTPEAPLAVSPGGGVVPGAASGAESMQPAAAAAARRGVEPESDRLLPASVALTQDATPATMPDPASPALTSLPAAPRPDGTSAPAPTATTPPVVIGRIEVHVDSPAAQPDPFAGCRVVAAGLTARRGGGW